jgi:general secretion pathway protein L
VLILTPSDFSLAPADGPTAQLSWVRSGDGRQALEHGRCAASLLPAETEVVLALPVRALSWHRLAVPKVASSRLRAALDGLLEERLLSDTTELHFALEPGARTGQSLWVAACDKAWLRSWLQALEAAGRPVSRIVPMLWPTAQAVHWVHDSGGHAWLGSASAEGVRCLPLAAIGHDRTSAEDADAQWLADPAVAAQAEQALDRRLAPVPLHDWLLRVAQSDWNLAQFDLSLSSGARRGQRLRQGLRQFRTASAWRPARWGLAALLVAQLLGLNAAAWHERSSLDAKRQAVRQTLQQTFPNVTLVLDAPVQMQRELAQLQQAGGQLSGRDLEAMLSALGSTGPGTTAQRLVYSPGELRLQAPEDQLRAQAQALAGGPWNAQIDGQALRLRPNTP